MGNANEKGGEYAEVKQNTSVIESIETTIYEITEKNIDSNRFFVINCNPNTSRHFKLSTNHPNFIELYNKIQIGFTYTIVFKIIPKAYYYIIDDIKEVSTHTICGTIKGFLDISKEFKQLKDYVEVVIENNDNKRRLLTNKEDNKTLIIGKKYTIKYKKTYCTNLYAITYYGVM